MRPVLILKTGTTLPSLLPRRGDYEDWILAGMGLPSERVSVVHAHRGELLPEGDAAGAIVVTGSSAMVSEREPWSERAAAWLGSAVHAGTPVLGICFGHQLLAHALGGRVERNPRGREMGTVSVRARDGAAGDPLFASLPGVLRVQATHQESVTALPPVARLLAESDGDPHHAFAVGERAWGVQFHPEFDADVMRAYLVERSDLLRAEGLDPDALLRGVADTPDGTALLRRFAEIADGA
jgi:GMP synthase (glutamine-hydrolysing)